MRRNYRASAVRAAARFARPLCPVTVSLAVLLATPGFAVADPVTPASMASLIADVAEADQQLLDLGAAVQSQQESVNKALVDVAAARDNTVTAQQELDASQSAVANADTQIASAQQRFDQFAAAAYMNGPASSYLFASDPADAIADASAGQTLAISQQKVMADLQRARTEQVNRESAARLAKQNADQAAADAQSSQDTAVSALTDSRQKFEDQQAEINRLAAERDTAQAKLDEARKNWAASAPAPSGQPAAAPAAAPAPLAGDQWDRAAAPTAAANTGQWDNTGWDPTLPAIPSAFVSGDPIAIINAVLGISSTSAQVTSNLGRNFLTQLGILKPGDSGITNGRIPRVYGRQASEYVINRMASQMGVPYSWGGGNAAGASRGIDQGAGTVGFDCSGLMLYGFAGVGIKLAHYTGNQYNSGRKIPSSQMRRGDMIFYGPNASQHVAMYLGDGQMLEAPFTGSHVKVSPLRTSGMTPYVTRLIEY